MGSRTLWVSPETLIGAHRTCWVPFSHCLRLPVQGWRLGPRHSHSLSFTYRSFSASTLSRLSVPDGPVGHSPRSRCGQPRQYLSLPPSVHLSCLPLSPGTIPACPTQTFPKLQAHVTLDLLEALRRPLRPLVLGYAPAAHRIGDDSNQNDNTEHHHCGL